MLSQPLGPSPARAAGRSNIDVTCPCPPRRWNNSIEPAAKEGLVLVRTPLLYPTPPHPTHPSIGSWGAQGIYIGDELLGGGVLVKELEAILQLCRQDSYCLNS